MLRIRYIGLLLATLALTACNPFSKNSAGSQFVSQKKQLVFMGHRLGNWSDKAIPQCTLCALNVYTIKLNRDVMLFKQINDERGDLVFLAATNVSHRFALQTGVYSYPVAMQIKEGGVEVTIGEQEPFLLILNQKQKMLLGEINYFIELQLIDIKHGAVDLNIWSESIMEANN